MKVFCCILVLFASTAHGATARLEVSNSRPAPGDSAMVEVLVDMDVGTALGAYAASLSWNVEVLKFRGVRNGTTSVFSGAQTRVDSSRVSFSQFHANGAEGTVSLMRVVFDVVGKAGQSSVLRLSFDALDAAVTFKSLLPNLHVMTTTLAVVSDETAGEETGTFVFSPNPPLAGSKLAVEVLLNTQDVRLGAYAGQLVWDVNRLSFVSAGSGATAAFAGPQTLVEPGTLKFSNLNVAGSAGQLSLVLVLFDVVGAVGQTASVSVSFDVLDAAETFENLLPKFKGGSASVGIVGGTHVVPNADFDSSGGVGFADFLLFAAQYGSRLGRSGYDAAFDLDGSGDVGFGDFLLFVQAMNG